MKRRKTSFYLQLFTLIVFISFFLAVLVFTALHKEAAIKITNPGTDNQPRFFSPQIKVILKNLARQDIPLNFDKDYDVPPAKQAMNTVRIPVLVYHHVGPVPGTGGERINNVSPAVFEQQLQYLATKEYSTLSIDEYIRTLKDGHNPIQKSVLITFDDGYADAYKVAFPLLKKYDFKATFFIPVNRSELTEAQLKEMADAGMDIESHTMNHRSMTRVSTEKEWKLELNDSKTKLETITGKPVRAFAYPFCVFSSASLNYMKTKAGYEVAFRCGNTAGNSIDNSNAANLEVFRSWQYNDLNNFIERLSGFERRPVDPLPDNKNGYHLKML